MSDQNDGISMRTIVLLVICIPVVIFLVRFSIKKNAESEERAEMCFEECTAQDYVGYSFKWTVLSGPQCECFEKE